MSEPAYIGFELASRSVALPAQGGKLSTMQDSNTTTAATTSANLYRAGTAGALAIGAGLVGLSEAQADVILTDFNVTITDDFELFDVNDDGENELAITDETGVYSSAKGFSGTFFAVDSFGAPKAVFLTRFYYGDTIDKSSFSPAGRSGLFYSSFPDFAGKSPWEDGERGFFGFAVPSDLDQEGVYYGYVEAQFSPGNTVTIFRIGFEDELGTPITIRDPNAVPAPGGIGLLALGAAGTLAYRRRRRKQAAAATA